MLVIGSGSITHNLHDFRGGYGEGREAPYVKPFIQWVESRLRDNDVPALLDYRRQAPQAERAHPTDEHLLPLFVAAGAAGSDALGAQRIDAGIDMGFLAMDIYRFDGDETSVTRGLRAASGRRRGADLAAHRVHIADRTHFDAAGPGPGKPAGDLHRLFQAVGLDQVETAEQFAGFGERAVRDIDLAIADAHAARASAGCNCWDCSSVPSAFIASAPAKQCRIIASASPSGSDSQQRIVVVDQQQVLHGVLSWDPGARVVAGDGRRRFSVALAG